MRRSKQTIFILKAKGSKPVKYREEISWQRTELAVLLCVLGGGGGEVLGLLRYMGYQRYWRPQRVWLLGCLCVKKV